MSVLESIIHDLLGLPLRKLVDVARYVHRLSETAGRDGWELVFCPNAVPPAVWVETSSSGFSAALA